MDKALISSDLNTKVDSLRAEAERLRERLREIDGELRDCVAAARLYGVVFTQPSQLPLRARMSIREIVIRRLTEAGPLGLESRDLRTDCGAVHPKTIGMTLFRLKKDGVCTRINGRTWVIN